MMTEKNPEGQDFIHSLVTSGRTFKVAVGQPQAGDCQTERVKPPSVKTLAEGVSGDFRHSGDGAGWLLVELICRQKTLQRLPLKPLNS